jgi:O-antigen/teichoic acid export membrane protein
LARNGAAMAVRFLLGMGLGLTGLLIVTRILGPEEYGRAVVIASLCAYFTALFIGGINLWIVRQAKQALSQTELGTALTLALIFGLCATSCGIGVAALLDHYAQLSLGWNLILIGFLGLPMAIVTGVLTAVLEAEMDFGRVAILELSTQFFYQSVAIVLALYLGTALAPVVGLVVSQVASCVIAALLIRRRLRLAYSTEAALRMLKFGIPSNLSLLIWQARNLTIPLVIAPALGTHSAGIAGLAWRLADLLSFPRNIAWRMGMPALARLEDNAKGRAKLIDRAALIQLALIGSSCNAFAAIISHPELFPFGERWLGLAPLMPMLAFAMLMNSAFNLRCAQLVLTGHNRVVAGFHAVNAALLLLTAWLLCPILGINALPASEAIACLSYLVVAKSFSNLNLPTNVRAWQLFIGAGAFSATMLWPPAALTTSLILGLTSLYMIHSLRKNKQSAR